MIHLLNKEGEIRSSMEPVMQFWITVIFFLVNICLILQAQILCLLYTAAEAVDKAAALHTKKKKEKKKKAQQFYAYTSQENTIAMINRGL